MKKKLFLLTSVLLLAAGLPQSQSWAAGTKETVNVETEGQLQVVVSELASDEVSDLTITGRLNAVDIKFLREQSGKLSALERLDLKGVTLVAGTEPYYVADKGLSTGAGGVMAVNYRYFYISDVNAYSRESTSNGVGGFTLYEYFHSNCLAGAFEGMSLKTVVLPESMKQIGAYAFYGCENMASVDFSSDIEDIGMAAFMGCKSLTAFSIPEKVDTIRQYTFANCSSLAEIQFHPGICSVQEYSLTGTAWYNNLEDGLAYAGNVAYCYKGKMPESTSLILKDGTTQIAASAFYDQKNLTTIELPSSLEHIERRAFYGCNGLKAVIIPDKVVSIGSEAFSGCSSMENLKLGQSLKIIENQAFYRCEKLTTLTIPSSVEILGGNTGTYNDGVFNYCVGLTEITIDTKSICAYCFRFCRGLKKVSMGRQVKSIGERAFEGCEILEQIIWPSSLETIGNYAFPNTVISKLELPSSLTSIGEAAFSGCKHLTEIHLPSSLKSTAKYLFSGCSSLQRVSISSGMETIEQNTFKGCTSLTEIVLPETLHEIKESAFEGCSLTSIVIPDGVTTVESNAFSSNPIEYLNLGNGISIVGNYAFTEYGSSNTLKKITLSKTDFQVKGYNPQAVYAADTIEFVGTESVIPKGFISYRSKVKEVLLNSSIKTLSFYTTRDTVLTIPEGIESLAGDAFVNYSHITDIYVPTSLKSVGANFSSNWYSLKRIHIKDMAAWCNVDFKQYNASPLYVSQAVLYLNGEPIYDLVIPEGITGIGENTFRYYGVLRSITIPSTVKSIMPWAFGHCNSLSSVTSYIENPFGLVTNAFGNVGNTVLYVPAGTRAKYMEKTGWNSFGTIIEMSSTGIESLSAADGAETDGINYDLQGRRTKAAKGIVLVRKSDGRVYKIIKR